MKDLVNANPPALGADEVDAIFDAAKKKAQEEVGVSRRKNGISRGVYKMPSGKFRSRINWPGKKRHIGTFDSPEQASAAYMSVKKDLANTNPSALCADEVDAVFHAAKKKAQEEVGVSRRKNGISRRI